MKIEIDPDIVDKSDKEMLEDLVVAAVNNAMEEAEEHARQALAKVSGGMMPNIPGFDFGKFGKP